MVTENEFSKVLASAGIEKVIAVDDYFGKIDLRSAISENLDGTFEYFRKIGLELERIGDHEIDLDTAFSEVTKLDDDGQKTLYSSISGNDSISTQDSTHLGNLKELLEGSGINYSLQSIDDYLKGLQDNISENAPKKTLAFIDLNLESCSNQEYKSEFGGLKLIFHGQKLLRENNHFNFAILTNGCTVNSEIEKHNQLAEENNFLLRQDYIVLSKERLDVGKEDTFAEGVKIALVNKHVIQIQNKIGELSQNAIEAARLEFDKLSHSAIFHGIFVAARIEGAGEIDFLARTMAIQFQTELAKQFSDNANLGFLFQHLGHCTSIGDGLATPLTKEYKDKLNSLMHLERFEGQTINNSYSPIINGDIFEIDGKEYVLLAQPCDLQLRSNGRRKLEIVTLLKTTIKSEEEKAEDNQGKVSYWNEEGSCGIVEYGKEPIQIHLDILDLCTYSPNGIGNLALGDENPSPLLSKSQVSRYKVLHSSFKKRHQSFSSSFEKFQQVSSEINSFNRELFQNRDRSDSSKMMAKLNINEIEKKCFSQEIPYSNKPSIMPDLQEFKQGKVIFTSVKRVKRIREPFATYYLWSYSQNRSRPAFPGDLMRE